LCKKNRRERAWVVKNTRKSEDAEQREAERGGGGEPPMQAGGAPEKDSILWCGSKEVDG